MGKKDHRIKYNLLSGIAYQVILIVLSFLLPRLYLENFGSEVNVGCGCATVNYNGREKNRTKVDDHAFIGCSTYLVAPVSVGKNSYTAAGSVITEDVPENSLAIARSRQSVKKDWIVKKKPYKWQK